MSSRSTLGSSSGAVPFLTMCAAVRNYSFDVVLELSVHVGSLVGGLCEHIGVGAVGGIKQREIFVRLVRLKERIVR